MTTARRHLRRIGALAALGLAGAVAACGDDSAGGAAGSGGGAGATSGPGPATSGAGPATSSGGSGGGGGSLEPSDPMEGWQTAFAEEPAGVGCASTYDDLVASNAPRLTFGETTIFVGYEQVGGDNQDPVFRRFDGATEVYCEHHERESPDGRAVGITWNGGPIAYVVYTMVGGGSAFDTRAQGGWLDRYGDGGGSAKVSFLGEVEVERGTLVRGTFVIAKKQDGKTNTHRPAGPLTVLPDGKLEFLGESAFQPMNPDRTIMQCTDYPFATRYVFSADLTTLHCSSSTNCTGNAPCPAAP